MRAILFDGPGEPEVLRLGDAPAPTCGEGEVLIRVGATAVNRADTLQRRGGYAPPPGASSILGLEVAGEVAELGAGVTGLAVGQQVMALLAGGGYAELVAAPAGQVMPIPAGLTLEQAAAIPEVFVTAYLNLFKLGGLGFEPVPAGPRLAVSPPARVLIHGGASGVGTAALQLCRAVGIVSYCTVGDDQRGNSCKELGASAAWNYRSTDWVDALLSETGGRGVDVVLDCIGGSYLERNLRALAPDGRLVCIGLMGGTRAELDLGLLLGRRLQVVGSTLRPLSKERKAALCREFAQRVLPLFADGRLRPVIDRVFPLAEAAVAHRELDAAHVGKLVLQVA